MNAKTDLQPDTKGVTPIPPSGWKKLKEAVAFDPTKPYGTVVYHEGHARYTQNNLFYTKDYECIGADPSVPFEPNAPVLEPLVPLEDTPEFKERVEKLSKLSAEKLIETAGKLHAKLVDEKGKDAPPFDFANASKATAIDYLARHST